jgi:general nucleoside transport system ATP-binding protein
MSFVLEARGITKRYPNGVLANDHVDLRVAQGEIHALVGENGAGKTTLMKALYGLEQPDSGQILLHGRPVTIPNPDAAIRHGIGMVHQHFMLIPSLTIAENIILGREPTKRGVLSQRDAVRITRELSEQYGLRVEPEARVDVIPVGERQRVEILKTLYRGAEILILDEPTAVLTPQETNDLFRAVRSLVSQGKTVIFITHKLREVKEISDNVTVMRRGKVVGTVRTADVTREEIARMMVGRDVLDRTRKDAAARGPIVLEATDLNYVTPDGKRALADVSLRAYSGEILGIAGVEGNGQTELVEVLAGLTTPAAGTITVNGKDVTGLGARGTREAGVSHIPEDRLELGLAADASIEENLIIDRYYREPFSRAGFINLRAEAENARVAIEDFDVRTPDAKVTARSLSGGNMQKLVVARELSAHPKLLLAAQPTRGIDIGATELVHRQLVAARDAGTAVVLVSADLGEVRALSDRLAVMYNGEIVAIFTDVPSVSEEELGYYMLGVRRQRAAGSDSEGRPSVGD